MRPLSAAQSQSLLARVGVHAAHGSHGAGLALLHRSFLQHVPFENLDIVLGRRIVLDEDVIFDKVVTAGRGGYCYELNSLFARLLDALGFSVKLVSARVYGDNGPSVEFDDFIERNDWQQASPDSHFTKGSVCTRLTDDGRVTLSGPGLGDRLIMTNWTTGERSERRISIEEVPSILADHFGIELDRQT
jgi:arylamine N-acetyltransferase